MVAAFTNAMNFKVLGQLENLTPVLKWVEIELSFAVSSYVFTLKIFAFIVQSMIMLYLVKYIKMSTIFKQFSEKEKRIKSRGKIWEAVALFQQLWNILDVIWG